MNPKSLTSVSFWNFIFKLNDIINNSMLYFSGFCAFALVLLVAEQVMARYFFNAVSIGMQEVAWHLFGITFLFAGAATLRDNEHVRVDIFFSRMKHRQRLLINGIALVGFIIPTSIVLIYYGLQYAWQAHGYSQLAGEPSSFLGLLLQGETSPDPGGLPGRWLIKSCIALAGGLILCQALTELLKLIFYIKSKRSDGRQFPNVNSHFLQIAPKDNSRNNS